MPSATLNLRVSPRRMLTAREAAEYIGLPAKALPVAPVEMPNGRRLYDMRDLDEWLDDLKASGPTDADDILGRLG